MMKNLVLVTMMLFLTSCVTILLGSMARGITEDFPKGKDSMIGAKIVVVRESVFQAGGKVVDLLLDGVKIARMIAGDHVMFEVHEGKTRVGIIGVDVVEFKAQKGMTYYFEISNNSEKMFKVEYPFNFNQVSAERGEELLKNTSDISGIKSAL